MIPNELRENPKLLRLRRAIGARISGWQDATQEQTAALMRQIEQAIAGWAQAIAGWARDERRRRKARKRRG